ncbi:MAG: BACON domain-containing carbohydrate-binding protein [Alistipes sp.]
MRKLMMILALGVLFAGCSNDDTDNGLSEIAIAPATGTFEIDHLGGTTEITVTSNADWRLTGKKTWCQPSAVAGKSGQKVTFTIEPNPTDDFRTITYKFFCGNKTIPFTVTQKPDEIFTFDSESTYDIEATGANFTIKMSTNIDFTYVIGEDAAGWVTPVETRGVHTERVQFTVATNDTFSARTGHITFTAKGQEYVVTVNQKQNNAIIPEEKIYNIDPAGATLTIKLKSNVAYTVQIPDKYKTWITPVASRGLVPGEETFTIGAAKGTRAGKINFVSKEAGMSVTVVVKQSSATPTYCTITDKNLRKYLASSDFVIEIDATTGKCEMTEDGMNATKFAFSSKDVVTLAGLEAFPSLTEIDCRYNNISVLDVSKFTSLTTLNATCNPLSSIVLGDSKVTKLDLGDNYYGTASMAVSGKNLTWINLYYNYNLETLDLSECPAVSYLRIEYCWYLGTLYLKKGQTIAQIVGGNPNIVYK